MKTPELERLVKEGWKVIGQYAKLPVYAKGNLRCIYNPEKDKVLFEYVFNITHIKKKYTPQSEKL